jgi:hypothetical protein
VRAPPICGCRRPRASSTTGYRIGGRRPSALRRTCALQSRRRVGGKGERRSRGQVRTLAQVSCTVPRAEELCLRQACRKGGRRILWELRAACCACAGSRAIHLIVWTVRTAVRRRTRLSRGTHLDVRSRLQSRAGRLRLSPRARQTPAEADMLITC